MLEQQLQVSDSELSKQSQVNWPRIQKLYHNTAKSIRPPEPDYQGPHFNSKTYTHEQVELLLSQFLKDITVKHSQQLFSLQQKVNEEILSFQKRINRLEYFLFEKKEPENKNPIRNEDVKPKYQTPFSKSEKNNSQIETTQVKPKRTNSFIYIEQNQDNDVSLLDGLQSAAKELYPKNRTKPAQQNGTSYRRSRVEADYQPPMRSFEDQQREDRINQQKINNLACTFHQKELKYLNEQIRQMKNYMEKAYNMEIRDLPWTEKIKNQKKQPNISNRQKVIINLSKNSQQHLLNENQALREMGDKYKRELKRAKRQVNFIRKILNEGLQCLVPIQPS